MTSILSSMPVRRAARVLLPAALLAAGAAWALPQARVFPVVDAQYGYLLGGTVNGRWVDAAAMAPRLRGGERYRVFGGGRLLGTGTGQRPRPEGEICTETFLLKVSPEREAAQVAVGGAWNALPRRVERLDPSAAVYREAVRARVAAAGIRNPQPRVTGAWRVDLDGNGTDEVVVSATRGDPSAGIHVEAGDYSLVFVRKVVNGAVRTIQLEGEFHPRTSNERILNQYDVVGILDLDGDGTMEIAVRGHYYEGGWLTIHRVRGTQKQELATAGCGV